jgi:hypothetical protein
MRQAAPPSDNAARIRSLRRLAFSAMISVEQTCPATTRHDGADLRCTPGVDFLQFAHPCYTAAPSLHEIAI